MTDYEFKRLKQLKHEIKELEKFTKRFPVHVFIKPERRFTIGNSSLVLSDFMKTGKILSRKIMFVIEDHLEELKKEFDAIGVQSDE